MWTTFHIDNLKKSHPTAVETQALSTKAQDQSEQEFFLKKPEYYFSGGMFCNCMPVKKPVGDGKPSMRGAESLHSNI